LGAGEDRSKEQEIRVARRLGGRRNKASGACAMSKGDVFVKERGWLAEAKTTGKKSMSVKRDWLVKISREASAEKLVPALVVSFEDVPVDVDRDWVMLPIRELLRLLGEA
jgi:hypothetical protein